MTSVRSSLLVLTVLAGVGSCQCASVCGDCNEDGVLSILDALHAAQIGVGLATPSATEEVACDVQPVGGSTPHLVDINDALVLAQLSLGLPTTGGCFPRIAAALPATPPHEFTGSYSLTMDDPDRLMPDFGCVGTTAFFDVQVPPGAGIEEVTISVGGMSLPTDMDLYIGDPGVPPGDSSVSNYSRRSRSSGSVAESFTIACSGLSAYGGSMAVAVHAFNSGGGGGWTFTVTGGPAGLGCICGGVPILVAGTMYQGSHSVVSGPNPPLPCGPASRLHELSVIPPGTTRITIIQTGAPPPNDYDLWVGWPGVCGGDCYTTNYHGSSKIDGVWEWGSPLWREELGLSGSELAAYGAGPVAIGSSVYSGPVGGDDYEIYVLIHGPAGSPLASAAGTSPVSGSVAHCRIDEYSPDVRDLWEFYAVTGDLVEISVDTATAEGAFDPEIRLLPSGVPFPALATGDDDQACTFPPPLSGGTECPALSYTATANQWLEVEVTRGPDGNCYDAQNGMYVLTVTLNGVPADLSPTLDDG